MSKNNKDFFKNKNSWSEIKDRLLGGYLPQYFAKVLKTQKPIYYVDCFAGKGKFDDGNDGSPRIALYARDKSLGSTRAIRPKIDTCFIDLNYERDLKQNLADFSNIGHEIQIISGKYEEKIEGLLATKKGANVFLYIDPYGIRALDSKLFDKFSAFGFNSIEMLINMNSFGLFRDACSAMRVEYKDDEALSNLDEIVEYDPTQVDASQQSENLLTDIAGGDYWKAIVRDFRDKKIDGYQAEKRLSHEYKQRLRQKYKYVLDMPIRMKANQRPKYRMIHVTNHPSGCYLMAQNMQSRKEELFVDIQQGGQVSMFDIHPTMTVNAENDVVTEEKVETDLLTCLKKHPEEINLTNLITDFVNDFGVVCDFAMIHRILEAKMQRGEIDIRREPEKTPTGKVSTFWEEKANQKVILRRVQ